MAKKPSTTSEKTNIRRITATDDAPKKAAKSSPKAAKTTKPVAKKVGKKKTAPVARDINVATKNPFVALGNYFRGAWRELKQVRWPTRGATWSMTLAVLLFSAVFVVFILLLDLGFTKLFELMLG
jgi:preprotein translocase SecE subunit